MKTKYLSILVTAFFTVFMSGCDDVLNPESYGQQTVDATFTDFNGCLNAANGLYAHLTSGKFYKNNDNNFFTIDQASDDVQNSSATVGIYDIIDYFELPANNATTYTVMDEHYRLIYKANVIINRVPKVSFPTLYKNNGTGTSFNDQFVGEALFMRAFAYYNLVRVLGNVPLRVEEITNPSQVNIPNTPAADVYKQIESDLILAAQKLPLSYTGSGIGNEKGRVTRWSALVLLADAYLTQKKYDLAKTAALQVIQNTSGYKLNNTYAATFPALNGKVENTQESLFEIQFYGTGASTGTSPYGHSLSWIMGPAVDSNNFTYLAYYRPTSNTDPDNEVGFTGGLIDEYEDGDLRKTANFHFVVGQNNINRWLTKKYLELGAGATSTGNVVLFRVADAYLIYAEAVNELGAPDALAIDYINQLRRRAFGLPLNAVSARDISSNQTQTSFRNIVRSERRKELAMENKRWFDLVRYGYEYANNALKINQKRTNFTEAKMLFPYPEIELINNPLLEQNPGY